MREEVNWWFKTAKINLARAKRSFESSDYEECAFWSHQAVEFALESFIIFLGDIPPKTHNLKRLYDKVKKDIKLNDQLISELTPYYSVSRYPDIFMGIPSVHRDTAKKFLEFAEEVLRIIGDKIGDK